MNSQHPFNFSQKQIYLTATIVSLLLSALAIYLDPLINRDGILYLMTAEKYLDSGYSAASEEYFWPFLSILIATTHQLTGWPLLICGWLLNTLFTTLVVISFIHVTQQITNNRQAMVWAAIIILSANAINEYRHYIIRDTGYWATLFFSLSFLAKYIHEQKAVTGIISSILVIAAITMRLEAALYLITYPVIAYLTATDRKAAIKQLIILSLPPVIIIATGLTVLISNTSELHQSMYTSVVHYFSDRSIEAFSRLPVALENYSTSVLDSRNKDFETLSLLGGLATLLAAMIVNSLGLIMTAILFFAWRKSALQISRENKIILFSFLLTSLIILLTFLLSNQFLTGRYMLTTTLALGLFVAIAINNLHQQYLRKGKGRKFLQTAFTLCLIMLTNTFISNGSSKDYILDSAKWMQNNSPQDAKILTNDAIVGYYSDRHFNSGLQSSDTEYLILSKPPLEFDYLVIKVKAKRTDFSKKFDERYKNIKAEKIFSNARGDKIAIYKNHAG